MPIDGRVVEFEPGETENDVIGRGRKEIEGDGARRVLECHSNWLSLLGNRDRLPICHLNGDWSDSLVDWNRLLMCKVGIHQAASSTTVDQCLSRERLTTNRELGSDMERLTVGTGRDVPRQVGSFIRFIPDC